MDKFIVANISLDIFCIILSSIPVLYMLSNKRYTTRLNLFFGVMAFSSILMIIGDLPDWLMPNSVNHLEQNVLAWLSTLYFSASAGVLYSFFLYMTEYMKIEPGARKLWKLIMSSLCAGEIFVALISPMTGFIFYVTESGYQRGPFFMVSQIIPFLCYGVLITELVVYRKRLMTREIIFFLIFILAPLGSCIIQMLIRGISIISPSIALTMILIFVNIQLEYEMNLQKKEKELQDHMVSLMLSQIQPHFLYNSLGTIAELCREDPQKAEDTTVKFAQFLRANMESLDCHGLIPFEKELNHVKNYLYLEQQRFGERLRVVYNIEEKGFFLPPLSLQPMVENAVVHGILRKKEGGCVTIATKKTGEEYIVTITDDGIGMQKAATIETMGRHSNMGIRNVRSRIASMTGGTLELESSDQGTKVTIRIPRTEIRG